MWRAIVGWVGMALLVGACAAASPSGGPPSGGQSDIRYGGPMQWDPAARIWVPDPRSRYWTTDPFSGEVYRHAR